MKEEIKHLKKTTTSKEVNEQLLSEEPENGYWKSLAELQNTTEFQQSVVDEFQSTPIDKSKEEGWARRDFLKLMGASLALSTFACTRKPTQKIVPYVKRPDDVIPGVANHYASSFVDGSEVFGVVVKTREGRPIKIEGNSEYPGALNKISMRATASVLSLYDPDRLKAPIQHLLNPKKTNYDSLPISWKKLDATVVKELKKSSVGVLTKSITSPSTRALLYNFKQTYKAKHYSWDVENLDALKQAQKISYGDKVVPHYRLNKAKMIVSVGADFLGSYLAPTEMSGFFAQGRKPSKNMNKLVVFESGLSLTGANADRRYPVKASEYLDILMGVLYQLVIVKKRSSYAWDKNLRQVLTSYNEKVSLVELDKKLQLSNIADELWKNRKKSLVIVGGISTETQESTLLHIAANFLNTLLSNDGSVVDYKESNYSSFRSSEKDLTKLIADIESGLVKRLIIHDINLVYSHPGNEKLLKALKKLKLLVYVGSHLDETAKISNFIAPDHNALEKWGDVEGQNQLYSIIQPTIEPLYETRAFEDSLITWIKAVKSFSAKNSYEYLKTYWRYQFYPKYKKGNQKFDDFWFNLLQKGFVDGNTKRYKTNNSVRKFNMSALSWLKPSLPEQGYELSLESSFSNRWGSMANVAWLQEIPHPITKICWDNYLSIPLSMAEKERLKEGQVVELKVSDQIVKVPVHIQPGQADNTMSLSLGYGQTYGSVAKAVGVNAFPLVKSFKNKKVYAGLKASITKTSKVNLLASTQNQHSMQGRRIVIEKTLDDMLALTKPIESREKQPTLWSTIKYKGQKWGMSIDLNTCTGCSSCVVACQSENNIPTVGKQYVSEGRSMHWLRIDRYHTGKAEDPDTVFQPVTCQHCDEAPCETVCPVAATVHGDEGTNDMIYNRCVGTRYCANNCPYKVRRFNWFDFTQLSTPLEMSLNPEVTVRDRGVMEKCSFCLHKVTEIRHKKAIDKKTKHIDDGEVKTACQEACPTNAINFGDSNDKKTKVSKDFANKRAYTLLHELNLKPGLRYQAKVKNVKQLKSEKKPSHHGGNNHG
ncbi:MAG: TAT-variant-translocated molybdopterin oxidoreductase [Bdellovibrionaceae bacterium]|nr:TAT-variant-translocated molybdopterin oxidoreductase [Pseudobdellovibrionaceae bacterium]